MGFGGPEKSADVIPFLENVLRGRNVPRERMLEVANHYYHFGGISPINQQNRDLIAVGAYQRGSTLVRSATAEVAQTMTELTTTAATQAK